MDKGAHFHRCDFQVHSPRDLNWHGDRPESGEARKAFAKDLIRGCRDKGLDAVAITDHHDVAFYKYIREAAQSELDSEGTPVETQITIFPGMELTLGIPCQALLILDADFPLEFLPQIPTMLGVTCNEPSERTHAAVVRLDHFTDFPKLHQQLDQLEFLRGRYIVLPNISSGGASTLQRPGFSAHYRIMPCVGGYLDHAVGDLGVGDRRILEGKIEAYAFKPLGIFPTSDNRHADFSLLGLHSVWVKWAEPTAEALRQACLARRTRILHSAPVFPGLVISSIHVSLSKFLGAFDLYLNPQYNCLIGGRGTGKSTILEYIRWALCDQPTRRVDIEEMPDFQVKRDGLVKNTLVPHNAVVTVEFVVNGVKHAVRRKSATGEILLKVGEDDYSEVSEEDIRTLLPLDAYSQKQLSAVGIRADELRRFIEAPVARRLEELRSIRSDSVALIRSAYERVLRKRTVESEISRQQLELRSLEQQLAALQAGLKGLSEADQAVLKSHERYTVENTTFDRWGRNASRLTEVVSGARTDLAKLPSVFQPNPTLPNNDILRECATVLNELFAAARGKLDEIDALFSDTSPGWQKFRELRDRWQSNFAAHNQQFEDVRQRAVEHEVLLRQIAEIEGRCNTLRETLAERTATLDQLGEPELEYSLQREAWIGKFREKADLLERRCNDLTQLSDNLIRARLRRGCGISEMSSRLQTVLEGTGVRGQQQKLGDLCNAVSESDHSVDAWQNILGELESLALAEMSGSTPTEVPDCPILLAAGFVKADIEKIAAKLKPTEWTELSFVELEDEPIFEYRQAEDEYIPFANASAGQQATALLRVLFNQQGPPLLIDQPEEDIDNPFIVDVVEKIWDAKKNRQIIFASHNANIVVNGDADLVACCAYRKSGDQSRGIIKCEGAIDVPEIRKEITQVMEGGRAAFKMRQEKYGF